MTLLAAGFSIAMIVGIVGIVLHHQFWRARQFRIRTEAEAFGGRFDDSD